MFELTIKNILINIWPMILIITIILSSLRISYLMKTKVKFSFYEEMIKLGFIIYTISLFHVVTFQDVSWSTSNFIPFKEILRYEIFSSMFFKNVVGNLIMFIPYGLFISYFLKLKKVYLIGFLSVITSLTIEITQLIIGRVFDIDDIFLNILGGIIGYFMYKIVINIQDKLPKFLKKEMFYNIIVILIIGTICFYIYRIIGGIHV